MFDFGKAHPNEQQEEVDLGDVGGSILSDGGQVLESVGHSERAAGAGGALGFAGDIMVGAGELAHGETAAGLGDIGSGVMWGASAVPGIANHVPGLGVAAGVSSAIGHGIEASKHVGDINKGYQNNKFWTETGDATLGVADAAAALDPTGTAGLAVGGSELLLDGAGALSGAMLGDDYRFTAGSVVGAGEHALFDTGQAIASGASSALSSLFGPKPKQK